MHEVPRHTRARTHGLLIRRPSGSAPYVLTFQPIDLTSASTLYGPRNRLLLQIADPSSRRPPCQSFLMNTFALTRAEARVCQQAAIGASYAEAAGALCLSVSTVKTHMRKTYDKLGVDSRAGLLAILHGALRATGPAAKPVPATIFRNRSQAATSGICSRVAANCTSGHFSCTRRRLIIDGAK